MTIGQLGFVDGTAEAEIRAINPVDGRVTVREIDSGTFWYGLDPQRFKSTRFIPLPTVEGEAPSDGEDRTVKTKESQRIRARLSDPLPFAVGADFLAHLLKGVKIRLLYRASVEFEVKSWFQENGLELPADIRPVKSDMQGVAGSVTFPAPDDLSILPQEINFIRRGDKVEINNLPFVVSLLKLGFPLNSYAKL